MAGKLKDLYVKRNQNQYQPASDSWEARASELNNMSVGVMQQEETAGNGALNYSDEALNCKQGDNGEYPSINEYADEVLGRMGNVADSARIDDTEENHFDEKFNHFGLSKPSSRLLREPFR